MSWYGMVCGLGNCWLEPVGRKVRYGGVGCDTGGSGVIGRIRGG